ncbi:hypothetical protein GGX14DRAFT_403632 [Mycena pura]|uniref:Uncharacterized protein n=1 Tax=Mycena pura TaxID=153505 RepID=A0AAD6Y2E4_9AGAR|nr:hypothetical protein GGX14DRAFT_403632 [Mycena pura]
MPAYAVLQIPQSPGIYSKSFAELSERGTNAETITCVKIKVVCFDGNESALSSSPHLPPLVPRGLPDASTQATGYRLKCYQAFAPAPVAVRPPQFLLHIVTSSDSDAAGSPFRTCVLTSSQVLATPPAPSLALCLLPARSALFARRPYVLHAARVFCTPPISVTSPTWSPGMCPLQTVPGSCTSLLPFLHVAPALCTAPSVCTAPRFNPSAAYLYDITVNTASAQQTCTDINDHFSVSDSPSRRPPPPVCLRLQAAINIGKSLTYWR